MLEVGAERTGERDRWVGRLVVLPALRVCGGCVPCRRGHAALCRRPHAAPSLSSHGLVAARLAVPLEAPGIKPAPGLLVEPAESWRLAALGDVGLRAYAALVRASVQPNHAAIVLGEGPLALFVAALVRHRGAAPIRIASLVTLEAGVAQIVAALAELGVEAFGIPLIDARDGLGLPLAPALGLARPGGAVVLCAERGADSRGATHVVAAGLSVFGVAGAHPDLLPELVAFACAGTLELAPLCHAVLEPAPSSDERVTIWRLDHASPSMP